MPVITGELVTYKGDVPIGHESFRDDGDTVTSDLQFGGRKGTISISRAKRHVRVEAAGNVIERDIPEGTLALENGHWQAYGIAAQWFADASTPRPVKVLLPAQGVTLDGTIAVTSTAAGGKKVAVELRGLGVVVELDPSGAVAHADVAAQGLEVKRASEPPPVVASREVPASVTGEPIEVSNGAVTLRGDLWMPKGASGKLPVVLLIAGSGPTDRDGNNAMGVESDAYRMLAEALATRGIASLRYDKRGVGRSSHDFDASSLVLDDFVADAGAIAAKLRSDPRFSTLTLAGHSEGGPIALLLAQKTPPDALVLLASPGRPLLSVIREQLAAKLDAAATADLDRILAAITSGSSPDPVPEALAPLFNPTVRPMIRSLLAVDPAALLRKLPKLRTAIIQGEHDAQVKEVDARALVKVRPDAKLTLLPTMNHVFKEEASAALPQPSYSDPSRPLAPGFVDAVVAAVPLR
jgi:pimeloyl-ACP methyl ester carboxylesterase